MIIISFEGMDGCGKTTQFNRLSTILLERGIKVVTLHEPGGSALGDALRGILLDPTRKICDWAEAYLFMASRAQMLAEVPPDTEVLLCDRYLDSSIVYQGYGNGLGMESIWNLSKPSVEGHYPDTTVYIKCPYNICRERLAERGCPDRIESKGADFWGRVERGYDIISEREPDRWVVVDGTLSPDEVSHTILSTLEQRYTKLYLRR